MKDNKNWLEFDAHKKYRVTLKSGKVLEFEGLPSFENLMLFDKDEIVKKEEV